MSAITPALDPPAENGSDRLLTGVTLAFLRDLPALVAELTDGGWPEGLTTDQLMRGRSNWPPGPLEWCIKDVTSEGLCCFIEWCEGKNLTKAQDGSKYFLPITHFVSHAWRANFPQLVATLESYATGGDNVDTPAAETAFFLDIFCINQHGQSLPVIHAPVPIDQKLKTSLEACRRTVMVLQPWEKPASFTRAWCLFEIMTTLEGLDPAGNSWKLDMALSPADQHRFVETLTHNFDDIMKNISNIDARKAEAGQPNDRTTIVQRIESGIGFWALNDAVISAIRTWLVDTANAALTRVQDTAGPESTNAVDLSSFIAMIHKEHGKYALALDMYKRVLVVRGRNRMDEAGDLDYAATLTNMGNVYVCLADYVSAEQDAYTPALEIIRTRLGVRHPRYALALSNRSNMYAKLGDHKRALEGYKTALEVQSRLPSEHLQYIATLNNMANGYSNLGDNERALEIFEHVQRNMGLGEEHPKFAATLTNIANVHVVQKHYKIALLEYLQVSEIQRRVLGESHPQYATTLNNIGNVYFRQGRYVSALKSYRSALALRRENLREGHPDTARTQHSIETVLQQHRLYVYARGDVRRKTLGMEKRQETTGDAICKMASDYEQENRHTDATVAYDYAGVVYTIACGANHGNTLDTQVKAASVREKLFQVVW
uniref:Mbre TPR repeat protein n=1 Tax=Mantoniella antarctica TaxID=81844 RepID=A0A7S0S853_9CHLO|mmetsp:Transcript_12998/g.31487  ORF Transcript_12998/g.31487 Transcript_12998/m.31487 type:complete len:659 (+) Transcript_12998:179-2155(+)